MSLIKQLTAVLLVSFLILPPVPLSAKNRKGDKLLAEARTSELKGDYDKALELAEQALAVDPSDPAYLLMVRRVRFESGVMHVKNGQKLRGDGKLPEALAEFEKAYATDPSSDIAEQEIRRTKEIIERVKGGQPQADAITPQDLRTLTPAQLSRKETQQKIDSLQPVPELRPLNSEGIGLKMMNKPRVLFETVCKLAGVNVLFDPEYNQQQTIQQAQFEVSNTTLEDALNQLSVITKSFWKPLAANTIFVTVDNPQKRRDYAEEVVKVFYLNNVTSPQEMQEMLTVLRTVVDVAKVFNYTAQNALIVRCEADTMALVEKLISDLDKPKGECIVDVMVMQVSSSYMRSLSAAFAPTGINSSLTFAPRASIQTPTTTNVGSTGTTTTGATTNTGTTSGATGSTTSGTGTGSTIPLSELGHIASADYSINLPGAQFEAVLNDSSTRVLQSPQIRASDNVKASIKIGEKVPTATGSFQPGVAGVGVSPLVNTQFTFLDVGVNVEILPRIHDNGEVSLTVDLDVSQVLDRIDLGGVSEPEIGQNKATVNVRLRDGEVNLIGGIIQDTNSRAITGIPGLANLPVIGRLFNSENVEKDKSELVIAIIPHIVRGPDISASNLRGVAAGTSTQIRVNMAPRAPVPPPQVQGLVNNTPGPAGPPATAPPLNGNLASPPSNTAPSNAAPANVIPMNAPPPPANALPMNAPPPPGPARVSFLPATGVDTQLGQQVTVSLHAENMRDLASAAAHLQFDSRILRITNITAGDLPQKNGSALQPSKNILNDTGTADFSVSRAPDTGGASGSGDLFSIVFQAVGRGNTSVRLSGMSLSNPAGQPIASNTPPELVVNVR
jgi:general secretion pathway protein D